MSRVFKYLQSFSAQVRAELSQPVLLLAAVSITLFLGVAGPFGTYFVMDAIVRLLYWAAVVAFSVVLSQAVKVALRMAFPDAGHWMKALAFSVLMTVIFVPIHRLGQFAVGGIIWESRTPVYVVAGFVFVIAMFVFLLRAHLRQKADSQDARLFQRFDDAEAGRILAITVRDHYVDVSTDTGQETLLMRFSDALAELEGIAGLQVHRSHWVANEAVQELKVAKGRSHLVLKNGTKIPVSRAYLDVVTAEFT